MVHINVLASNLYRLMTLAHDDGLTLSCCYKKRVFKVTIEPTGETYDRIPWTVKQRKAQVKGPIIMRTESCPSCNSIVLAGICINRDCIYTGPVDYKEVKKTIPRALKKKKVYRVAKASSAAASPSLS